MKKFVKDYFMYEGSKTKFIADKVDSMPEETNKQAFIKGFVEGTLDHALKVGVAVLAIGYTKMTVDSFKKISHKMKD